ncbi:hypothetical protein [Flagellimonas onchidii]|uniref:hypothetical protein n=1 Tax=Flagellimonas onchidii TaxID=2562684 RepID=UPI0010A6A1C7|nr:hypothetical protein [Allomuricauda onchidii]
MDFGKIFTNETTIKISVVKLDNKKMTKGIFNQLHISSPFDKLYNLKEEVQILGYVNEKDKWVIWSNKQRLYKYEIYNFSPLIDLDLNKDKIKDLYHIYPSENIRSLYFGDEHYSFEEISSVLDKKEQYEILDKQEILLRLRNEILNRQIFL